MCIGLPYRTMHVVDEGRYQLVEVGGVGAQGRWIPTEVEGGTFASF